MTAIDSKAKRGKCLALVAVLAMIVCAFAIALPTGESDAATDTGVKEYTSGPLASGKYYVKAADNSAVSVTIPNGVTATVYVAVGTQISITIETATAGNSTGTAVVKVASSYSNGSVTYYDGVSADAEADKKYAGAENGMVTDATEDKITYSYSLNDGTKTTYYAPSANATVDISAQNAAVNVKKGTVTVNAGVQGTDGKVTPKDTIVFKDINTATPYNVKVDETYTATPSAGKITISGGAAEAKGSITMKAGTATISSVTPDTALNGFSTGTNLCATVNDAGASTITAVYGTVKDTQTLVINTNVEFKNAKATALTVKDSTGIDVVSLSVDGNAKLTYTSSYSIEFVGTEKTAITLISGEFHIGSSTPTLIAFGQNLMVSDGATLNVDGKITLNGSITVSGKILGSTTITVTSTDAATGTPETKGEFRAFAGAEIGQKLIISKEKKGIIDIASAQKRVNVDGIRTSNEYYPQNQIVVVNGSYEVTGTGVVIEIAGGLEIPAGSEMIISKGAEVVVNGSTANVKIDGKLIVEDGAEGFEVNGAESVSVSGKIEADALLKFSTESMKVKNDGSIVSNNYLETTATGMTVEKGGMVTLSGKASICSMANAGSVTLNEVELINGYMNQGGTSTISLIGADATVDIVELTLAHRYSLVIDDHGLKNDNKDVGGTDNVITFTISNGMERIGKVTISGVQVSASVMKEKNANGEKVDVKKLNIKGTALAETANEIVVDTPSITPSIETITVTGPGIVVSDSLVIGEKVLFVVNVDNGNVMTVSGQLTATAGRVVVESGMITVTGLVQTKEKITHEVDGDTISSTDHTNLVNAVYFKTVNADKSTIHNYTTLAAAIASGSETIEVLGTVNVGESAEIPAGMTMKVTGTLNIGDSENRDVTVTVAKDARATGSSGKIVVDGTLIIKNAKDCRVTNIISDVRVNADPEVRYTNIYTALNNAAAGDTVEITKSTPVIIGSDITVKEGVTLKVPAGKSIAIENGKKITITVAGTIVSYAGISGTFGTDASKLKITGQFLTGETDDLSALNIKYNFDGAYYTVTDSNGTYKHITTIENAVADAQKTEKIVIFGTVTAGDLAVEGKKTALAEIELYTGAKFTVASLKLTYATLDAYADAQFDGTVASDVGSVKLTNVKAFTIQQEYSSAEEKEVMVISGTIAKKDSSAGAAKAQVVIDSGIVCARMFDITGLDKFSIASAATLEVDGEMKAQKMSVGGTLNVSNGGVLAVTDYIEVTGTLTVADVDGNKAAGTLTVPKMYVGISQMTVGGAAAVDAPAVSDLRTVYLATGSTVSPKVLENLRMKSEFTIEGVSKFTVYTDDVVLVKNVKAPSTDGAKFQNWQYTDNGKVKDVSSTTKVGDYAQFSALLKFDVYKIKITADYGFSDVYIDGEKVATASGGIAADKEIYLKAGDHTVTWKLRNNYSGDITGTFDGKAMTDGKFTIAASMPYVDSADNEIVYEIVLTGAQQQAPVTPSAPEKDDGMGITDILLIVLVVLIAVMAIMVALRLMRS